MTFATEEALRGEVAHLGSIIAGLIGANDPTVEGLTKSESRIVRALESAAGRLVKREALRSALYFDRFIDDEPASRIVDCFICLLRLKRPDISARLFGVWGIGYRLVPA